MQSLEDGQSRGRGQRASIDVLSVGCPVEGWLRGAPVDLRQRVLEQLDGGQDLGEKRPLLLNLLHAVSHQPLHGFRAVLVELAEIREA